MPRRERVSGRDHVRWMGHGGGHTISKVVKIPTTVVIPFVELRFEYGVGKVGGTTDA